MDIEEMWKNMEPDKKQKLLPDTELLLHKIKSNNPLEKIKSNLLINIAWGILIFALYIVVFLKFDITIVRIAIILVAAFTIWIMVTAWLLYKNINTRNHAPASLLKEMEYQLDSISKWIRNQEIVGVFLYPVSIVGGFLLGGVIGSGKTAGEFMSKPILWGVLLAAIVVITPLCYLMTRKLFKITFGKHLDSLQKNINALKSAE